MNVFCKSMDSCTLVSIDGDIISPEDEKVHNYLLRQIEEGNIELLVDLTAVKYIDSSGISMLLRLLQNARRKGGDIRIYGISERVGKIFNQVGLSHIFKSYNSQEEGIISFSG
ncbi:MAG TPA: STAS domain-containing protein [bacterium]